MALFKHKNGGICEVLTQSNIDRLRKDSNYKEVKKKLKESEKTKNKETQTNQEETNQAEK